MYINCQITNFYLARFSTFPLEIFIVSFLCVRLSLSYVIGQQYRHILIQYSSLHYSRTRFIFRFLGVFSSFNFPKLKFSKEPTQTRLFHMSPHPPPPPFFEIVMFISLYTLAGFYINLFPYTYPYK